MHLTEEQAKARLRALGIRVPSGAAASTAGEARAIADRFASGTVIKALVPTGRRGKAGAVRIVQSPDEAATAAQALVGTSVNGFRVPAVYVEERVDIAHELYLAFMLEDYPPKVIASTSGGVDIESVHTGSPGAIVTRDIDPWRGLPTWDAVALWERAGLDNASLTAVASITSRLYDAFVREEATMLEVNPLCIDASGNVVAVGAMMAVEDTMFEQGADDDASLAFGGERALTSGERRVIEANKTLPGGMVHYHELDGDIGMFVGGGGAGLLQHDLILAAGGRPANHTDASTVNPDKVRVLIDTILDNPRVRSLFVSWHYQQMAQIDKRVIPVIDALRARKIDPKRFPVVIRMFGRGEEIAREAAARLGGIHYLPHGAPLSEGVRLIVDLTRDAQRRAA